MSGGMFDYFNFDDDIAKIKNEVKYHSKMYKPETIKEFKTSIDVLKKADVYLHRIDWFLSGDDSEETFLEEVKADLELAKPNEEITPEKIDCKKCTYFQHNKKCYYRNNCKESENCYDFTPLEEEE